MYFAKKIGRTLGSFLLTVAILASQFSSFTTLAHATSVVQGYYVSVSDGKDSNPGTLEKPFKTIQKAADTMKPGDTCYIRGGVYSETVTPKSGAQGSRITYTNYKDEIVTVSGCNQITGWVPDGKTEGIYKAKMDWSLGDKGDQNQVFVNGTLMYEARYPNVQPDDTLVDFTYAMTKSGTGISSEIPPLAEGDTVPNRRGATSYLVDPAFKEFAKTEDFFDGAKIWMVPGTEWTSLTSYASSYNPEEGKISFPSTYRGMKNKGGYYTPKSGVPYYVFGAYKLLDTENEWWYDTKSEMLHVKIANGANPDEAGAYIEAKKRLNAFDLSNCSFINIVGVNVRGSTVITDETSSYITMKDMKCEYVSHNSTMSLDNLTDNSSPQDDLGVLLKGSFIEVDSCEISNSSGPVINLQGSDNRLVNSYIHDGNYIGTYCGHSKISGRRQFVSHNTMTRSGRDVLSFRDLSESVVQYNDISDAGYLTLDLGMMYSANTDGQNTQIHHNVIHDNHTKGNNNGFYPDEMSHNFIVYQNIVYGSGTGLVFNHPSLYNLAYNNSVYDKGSLGDSYTATFKDDRGRQFMNNILTDASQKNNKPSTQSTFYRGNLLDGEPGFADAEKRDFRLAEKSAAIGRGVPIKGVTDPAIANPSAGAIEYGQENFVFGHNFENPPVIANAPDVNAFEYRNRVKNGGFEYGSLENWTGNGTPQFEDSWHSMEKIASTGYYGLVLDPGQSVSQTITGLEPKTEYSLALNARPAVKGASSSLEFGTAGQTITEEITGSKWANTTREFATVSTDENNMLVITIKNIGENVLYVDDIGMQKVAKDAGVLSSPVSYSYDSKTYQMTMSFEPLAEGHHYYYSALQTPDTSFTEGKFIDIKPVEYDTELKSGDKVNRIYERYLNIVEVDAAGLAIGYQNILVRAAAENVLKPVQDTFVNANDPLAVPSGEAVEYLRLNGNVKDGTRTGYVQFDLTNTTPGTLMNAKLQLYVYKTTGKSYDYKRKISVKVMPEEGATTEGYATWSESWDEATLVYGKPIADGGQGVIANPGRAVKTGKALSLIEEPNGVPVELDITALLKDKCGQKVTLNLSIGITSTQNSEIYIPSTESVKYANEKYQTKLVLETTKLMPNIDAVAPIDPIIVDYGTKFEDIALPKQASATVAASAVPAMLDITWEKGNYNETIADNYVLTGKLALVDGILNVDNRTAVVQVTVKQKPLEGPTLDELKTLIQTAEGKKAEEYSPDSFANLQAAIQAAKATVSEVETALQPVAPPKPKTPESAPAQETPESAPTQETSESAPTQETSESAPTQETPESAPAPSEEASTSIAPTAAPTVMLLSTETGSAIVSEDSVVFEAPSEVQVEVQPEAPIVSTLLVMTNELQAKINESYKNLSAALDQLVKRIFFTVQFMDERGEVLPAVTAEQGTLIAEPAALMRDGYEFGGWYTDGTCAVKFDFTNAISGNESIFAKWTQIVPPTPDPDPTPDPNPTPNPVPPTNPNSGTHVNKKDVETEDRVVKAEGAVGGEATIPPEVTNIENPKLQINELVDDSDEFKNFAIAAGDHTLLKVFDIQLNSNGKVVTKVEGGRVTVSIPFDGKEGEVYYILRYNADKTVTEIPAVYANGMLTFVTDHFSLYAIALKNEVLKEKPASSAVTSVSSQTESQAETVDAQSEKEASGFGWLMLVVALLAVAVVGVVILIRRNNSRR